MSWKSIAFGMGIVFLLTVIVAAALYYTDLRIPVKNETDIPGMVNVPQEATCTNLTYSSVDVEGSNFTITRSVNGGEAWLCCDTWGFCFWSDSDMTSDSFGEGVLRYV